ncbi:TIR domain-containing protein [Pseudorhodobacter sp. E13]|uniref:toll/interleukin-1 receptor domain-containing protein n=1 Tax=Pseudorhodobacter sp. E13 TaxID=2487931 RepID=UPI000F8D11A5|nr:toll/interleukin-1 receptor domain-containing protein [Pseudorhodobacter sp. E13]RUS64892.1 TIR domain-containing protein [Pseudorhodobacter sp. E13]
MIDQSSILAYSSRAEVRKSERIVEEARQAGKQTAFLSHSHKDSTLAKGLQGFLQSKGWHVYIDWEDMTMPSKPNRETAQKIKEKIKRLDWFFYLATANSASSRWCPWEIGYADGVKDIDKIVIIPTRDSAGWNHGNEYLDLYRYVDVAQSGGYGLFYPNNRGMLLENVRR